MPNAAPFDVRNKTQEGRRDGVREQAMARAKTAGSVARKIAERDRAKPEARKYKPGEGDSSMKALEARAKKSAAPPSADRRALAKSMIGEKKPRIPGLGKKE